MTVLHLFYGSQFLALTRPDADDNAYGFCVGTALKGGFAVLVRYSRFPESFQAWVVELHTSIDESVAIDICFGKGERSTDSRSDGFVEPNRAVIAWVERTTTCRVDSSIGAITWLRDIGAEHMALNRPNGTLRALHRDEYPVVVRLLLLKDNVVSTKRLGSCDTTKNTSTRFKRSYNPLNLASKSLRRNYSSRDNVWLLKTIEAS